MGAYTWNEVGYTSPAAGGSEDPAKYRVIDIEDVFERLCSAVSQLMSAGHIGCTYPFKVRVGDFLAWQ